MNFEFMDKIFILLSKVIEGNEGTPTKLKKQNKTNNKNNCKAKK